MQEMESEHKQINQIIKLIRTCEYEAIDIAIDKLVDLKSDKALHRLLQNTVVDKRGILWVNPKFVVTGPRQPAMDYAFWQIIGKVPSRMLRKHGIFRDRIRTIRFKRHISYPHNYHSINKFPNGILNFKNLRLLDMGICNVSSLPDQIDRLSKLEQIICYSYCLDILPESIGRLSQLVTLDLGYCHLRKLPNSIVDLTGIKELRLNNNKIESLPAKFGNLTSLRELNLSGNELTEVPQMINQLSNLESLHLGGNKIDQITNIFDLSRLKNLSLSDNKINDIPNEIEHLESLISLNLNRNASDIKISSGFSNLEKLESMSFFGCNATPKLTRKEFNTRNHINQYFKKLRRFHQHTHDDLIYIKPTPNSWSSSYRKTPGRRYKKEIQSKINEIKSLLRSNFSEAIKLLKNIKDINVFIGSTHIRIGSSGELHFDYYLNKSATIFINLLNHYKKQKLDFKSLKLGKVRKIRLNLSQENQGVFEDLLIFKNLTALECDKIDSNSLFKSEIFKQINHLVINYPADLDIHITNYQAPELRSFKISEGASRMTRIVFSELPRLESVTINNSWRSKNLTVDYFKVSSCPNLSKIKLSSRTLKYFELSQLTRLNHLDVEAKLDSCAVKTSDLPALQTIILAGCDLTSLPKFVKSSYSCEILNLFNNKLTGNLSEVSQLSNLSELDLRGNNYTNIPTTVYSLFKLTSLSIGANIKTVSEDIRNLTQLKTFVHGWNDKTCRKHYYLLRDLVE